MARILIRNLDGAVVRKLKRRAKRAGRSFEGEVGVILEEAASEPKLDMKTAGELAGEPKLDAETAWKLLDEFSNRFKGRKFTDSAELIRGDRDR